MEFQEMLDESFNTKPVKWTKKGRRVYFFEIDKNVYQVDFFKQREPNTPVIVSFWLKERNGQDAEYSYDLTFTGDQFKVLSTVMAIMKDYIETQNPDKIAFSADKALNSGGQNSKSRVSVYSRMIKRYIDPKEWDLELEDLGWEVRYILTRKKK